MSRILIHNAIIVNENRRFRGFVVIDGDKISAVSQGDASSDLIASCDMVEDASGAYLLPGAIDDQVHFRDPGLTHKADMATESRAAVAGGVTSFMDMPNTKPQTVTLDALKSKQNRAAEVSVANYAFFIGATNDNIDVLLKCDYSEVPGVKLFLGSSTGNMLVDQESTLDRIFTEVPALIAIHSEDEAIIRRNREAAVEKYGDDVPVDAHPEIRSNEACYVSTARAVARAERCGSRLHVLHVSTAEELALFTKAPIENKKITAEVCVHHLWWTDKDYPRLGTRIKWNPAIKSEADRDALCRGLRDGLIDIVATDHAPHLLAEKQGTALTAASGGPFVQYSLPAMMELADQGVFTLEMVVEKMAHAPARLFRIENRGFIRPGYYADLTIVRPHDEYVVSDADVVSRCGWTPLDGTTLHNRVISTYVNGHRAYHNGEICNQPNGMPLKFEK